MIFPKTQIHKTQQTKQTGRGAAGGRRRVYDLGAAHSAVNPAWRPGGSVGRAAALLVSVESVESVIKSY